MVPLPANSSTIDPSQDLSDVLYHKAGVEPLYQNIRVTKYFLEGTFVHFTQTEQTVHLVSLFVISSTSVSHSDLIDTCKLWLSLISNTFSRTCDRRTSFKPCHSADVKLVMPGWTGGRSNTGWIKRTSKVGFNAD